MNTDISKVIDISVDGKSVKTMTDASGKVYFKAWNEPLRGHASYYATNLENLQDQTNDPGENAIALIENEDGIKVATWKEDTDWVLETPIEKSSYSFGDRIYAAIGGVWKVKAILGIVGKDACINSCTYQTKLAPSYLTLSPVWSVSDKSIATIDSSTGVLTAVSKTGGNVTVIAMDTASGLSATKQITARLVTVLVNGVDTDIISSSSNSVTLSLSNGDEIDKPKSKVDNNTYCLLAVTSILTVREAGADKTVTVTLVDKKTGDEIKRTFTLKYNKTTYTVNQDGTFADSPTVPDGATDLLDVTIESNKNLKGVTRNNFYLRTNSNISQYIGKTVYYAISDVSTDNAGIAFYDSSGNLLSEKNGTGKTFTSIDGTIVVPNNATTMRYAYNKLDIGTHYAYIKMD